MQNDTSKKLVAQMTLEEMAGLCSGQDFWMTKGVERLGLPAIRLSDGPHGLRKQLEGADHIGLNASLPATCFPTASAAACSFDTALLYELGRALGQECRKEDVAVILGPGVNHKRHPYCGRNFEYFSEDPLLSGLLAAAYIRGVQSQGVGTALKHFAANNQETKRFCINALVDERSLRELYLRAFEMAIKEAAPWTVMCAYNQLNGSYCSEHRRLLTDILRGEWGFDGVVMTDWGAICDRVKGLCAGVELEMPGSQGQRDEELVHACQSGALPKDVLEEAARRMTELILRASLARETPAEECNMDDHHALAVRIAQESAVLVKNEGGILPFLPTQRIAVLGGFAKQPRVQGTGSSKVHPTREENAFEELKKWGADVRYAQGYPLAAGEDEEALLQEALALAGQCDVVVVFAGLPEADDAEGFDRSSLALPENQNRLIHRLAAVHSKLAVVLCGGSVLELPWADEVPALFLCYLGGQGGGRAMAELLLGQANPAGRLAESWPYTVQDVPSHANFPGGAKDVQYREGLFTGYRYYTSAQKPVRFAFGHGLSYTRFAYSHYEVQPQDDGFLVSCRVQNTGKRSGSEVVQLYSSYRGDEVLMPARELRGFEKVSLEPGEGTTVRFALPRSALAFYHPGEKGWRVAGGEYRFSVAPSSAQEGLGGVVTVAGDAFAPLHPAFVNEAYRAFLQEGKAIPDEAFAQMMGQALPAQDEKRRPPFTEKDTLSDIRSEATEEFLHKLYQYAMARAAGSPDIELLTDKTFHHMPLRTLPLMMGDAAGPRRIKEIVHALNEEDAAKAIAILAEIAKAGEAEKSAEGEPNAH